MRIALIILSCFYGIPALAQTGFNPQFNFLQQLQYNPAALEARSKSQLHLFSVQASGGGTRAAVDIKDWSSGLANTVRDKIIGHSAGSSGWGELNFNGPAWAQRLNKRNVIALWTGGRLQTFYNNLDGRLLAEVNESHGINQTYPYAADTRAMLSHTLACWEWGLAYRYTLLENSAHRVHAGLSLKYINTAAYNSISIQLQSGIVDYAPPAYITDATGSIATQTSGSLFNKFSVGDLLFKGEPSFAGSLGLVYEWLDPQKNEPRLRAGVSVTDIGRLTYQPDSLYSKQYDINLEGNRQLYFSQHIADVAFNRVSEVLDDHWYAFSPTSVYRSKQNILLPAVARVFLWYDVAAGFSVQLNAAAALQKTGNSLPHPWQVAVAPQYRYKKFSLQVPVMLQQHVGWGAGLYLKYGGFYIGAANLTGMLAGQSRWLDASMGMAVKLGNRQ